MPNVPLPPPQQPGMVADFLHGVIPVTPVERFVTSTPAFNRLHDVKQNSTAFLTYPSMIHSRFGHSLGAMHLAGQMFVSATSNASKEDLTKFLKSVSKVVEQMCHIGPVFKKEETAFSSFRPEQLKDCFRKGASRSTLIVKTAPNDVSGDLLAAYCVALQALRLAALAHDLGHPPFSHVTEYAVKTLAIEVKASGKTNGRRKELVEVYNNSLDKSKELHEFLTLELFGDLQGMVGESVNVGIAFRTLEDHVFARISMAVARGILLNGTLDHEIDGKVDADARLALSCLRSLEDGILDADRLDYVQRDVLMAGIRDRGFRPERLVSLLKLVYDVPTTEEKRAWDSVDFSRHNVPRVLPSIRSLRSLEEFFEWRSELYRTVIFHHHVVRTDGLFEALIKSESESILDESDPGDAKHAGLFTTTSSLHWLWNIYVMDAGTHAKMDVYLQWDDHWLMSVLRWRYLQLKDRVQDTALLNDPDLVQFRRLEEIVGSKKNYISLVKRYEHYLPISDGFDNTWSKLVNDWLTDPANHSNNEVAARITQAASFFSVTRGASLPPNQLVTVSPQKETILERIGKFVTLQGASNPKKQAQMLIEKAVEAFKVEWSCLDVFWKNKPPKGTVENDLKVWTDNGVEMLSHHSNLDSELKLRAGRAPQYFFYALPRDKSKPFDVAGARTGLGASLARTLFEHLLKETIQ